MKRIALPFYATVLASISVLISSCADFLDVKPNRSWVVPNSAQDFQAILDDNTDNMNKWRTPVLIEVSSDDYYLTENDWKSIGDATTRNTYVWASDIFEGDVKEGAVAAWSHPYGCVFRANYVLEGIQKIKRTPNTVVQLNQIEGSALFYRSWAFHQLAQLFCKPYHSNTADSDLGLPIRLESDITLKSKRASVQNTYSRIIEDLKAGARLLPETPVVKTRPGKSAAYGLLARVYLQMGDYEQAYRYADSCLLIQPTLIDYNEIDLTLNQTFMQFNEEVIFHSLMVASPALMDNRINIDSVLYVSYAANDLRKQAFFRDNNGKIIFKGSYSGLSVNLFGGIATDEIYLIRAEAAARLGLIEQANQDLNTLMAHRKDASHWNAGYENNQAKLLRRIVDERRKELILRGIRWGDLRRYTNTEFAHPIYRKLGSSEFQLLPGGDGYVLPIPHEVVEINNLQQNP